MRLGIPKYGNVREALHFAQTKSNWLAERFAEALPLVPVANGTILPFMGCDMEVCWSKSMPRKPSHKDGKLFVGGPVDRVGHRVLRWLKDEARAAFQNDLDEYCDRAGDETPRLSVGDARRRWGSCSGKKSIRLSWRLIMAPAFVRRSVVAHEVAHLQHMNHSKAFYNHLDSIFEGDRKVADRWLKQHGARLYLIDADAR